MSTQAQGSNSDAANKEDDKSHNFEQLRKKYEASEREKLAAQAKVAQFEREIADAAKKKLLPEPVEDDSYDEPYVDEKRLNKKLEKFEARFVKQVDEQAERKAASMLEQERNKNFLKQNPDFSEVLSPDVIEKFAQKHPEIAEQMLDMPEGFSRQKLLYQNIKALGIHKPPENKPSIQETVDKNRKGAFYQPTGIGNAPYAGGGDFSATGQKSAYDKIQELKSRLRL